MIVVVKNHPYSYDVENLAEIFFPYEKIKVLSQLPFASTLSVSISIS